MKDLIIAARPKDGFRRCGVHHPPAEVHYPAGFFSEDQVEALRREPNLLVVEVEPAASANGEADPKKPRGGKTPPPAS